ncbi:phthiocerol/phthiodiolone dimycocerosyl transferase family protein [Amycolatopsis pithecellobii]|uniref:Phthiocerol/phthiodiolone dimycocerosyl transferase n=1 Tax=Amycolatopsis pithecellobii TaxID=664692 RepID=A0A6N7ZB69_9PSEU|nr:hypothetical protein [Amycolatopsis pithecellobii]MTD59002.1 hypothetical protein [Amycolatopsis pithecellobii]
MPLERNLDNIELQAMHHVSAYVVVYEGEVDLTSMHEAYRLLCVRHPVLRARVERVGTRYRFRVPESGSPRVAVHRSGGENHLREVGRRWRPDDAVAQLTLVKGETRGLVAMFTDHAIADGKAKLAYLHELLRLYGEIVAGTRPIAEPGRSLPDTPSQTLRARVGSEAMPPVVNESDPRDFLGAEALRRYIRLSPNQTKRLVAVARQNKTTVYAVLCGVILLAQRRYWQKEPPATMICLAMVNLRERVTPRVGALDTTNFIGVSPAEVKVEADTDPIALGREVREFLENAIAQRRPEQEILARTTGSQSPPVGQDLGTAAISNLGVVSDFPVVPNVRITDFQIFTQSIKGATPSYGVYTYQGCLSIEAFYRSDLYPHSQADSLVEDISREIARLLDDEGDETVPRTEQQLVGDVG